MILLKAAIWLNSALFRQDLKQQPILIDSSTDIILCVAGSFDHSFAIDIIIAWKLVVLDSKHVFAWGHFLSCIRNAHGAHGSEMYCIQRYTASNV